MIKSWEEYLHKKQRGDALLYDPRFTDAFFERADYNETDEGYDLMKDIAQKIKKRLQKS